MLEIQIELENDEDIDQAELKKKTLRLEKLGKLKDRAENGLSKLRIKKAKD